MRGVFPPLPTTGRQIKNQALSQLPYRRGSRSGRGDHDGLLGGFHVRLDGRIRSRGQHGRGERSVSGYGSAFSRAVGQRGLTQARKVNRAPRVCVCGCSAGMESGEGESEDGGGGRQELGGVFH